MTNGVISEPSTSVLNLSAADCALRSTTVSLDEAVVELDLSNAADPTAETFESVSTVQFQTGGGQTWIDIVAAEILSATVNGQPVDTSNYDGARLEIAGLAESNTVVVRALCRYSRTGEGLHRFTDPEDGNTFLYTHCEPTDARRVFACFEQPDLKARWTFIVRAPAAWVICSGQPEVSRTEDAGVARVTFAPTPPLSSYLTAVAAGPYHRVDSAWTSDAGVTINLGLMCRPAMSEHLDADDIFTVTGQALEFYHQQFAFPYPWGKYDQIFVPEYNIGAMENPGLVTFTENYLPRGQATRAQLVSRASVIAHEMAHMWFGDLVTMRWWDGLWLKESFADLMGYLVAAEATQYSQAWTSFAVGRKQWAYRQDQLPTTHPIETSIDDVEAARQNFDGITYAKGAAVLKQLHAYVGSEAFFAGVRQYFATHAFGNTELADLLAALETASGRDLSTWAGRWLQTSGICELVPQVTRATDGTVLELAVRRRADDALTGEPVQRPHRIRIGCYRTEHAALSRDRLVEVDLIDDVTVVPDAVGAAADLVLLNDDDLTYAMVRLDRQSLHTATDLLSTITASLPRSLVWSMLWNATRDGLLPVPEYLSCVYRHLVRESDPGMVRIVLDQANLAVKRFVRQPFRAAAHAELLAVCDRAMHQLEAGSDLQLTWARAAATAAATASEGTAVARGLLDGTGVPAGLRMDDDLLWSARAALAAQDAITEDELAAALAADNSMSGRLAQLLASASRPRPEVADATWASMVDDGTLTNDQLRALVAGFRQSTRADAGRFVDRYFDGIEQWWRTKSMVMASILVDGLFPASDLTAGGDPDDNPVVTVVQKWLADNASAPTALRRILIEQLADLQRALRVQQAAAERDAAGQPTPDGSGRAE